jgi:hypothetical protein
MPLDPVGQQGQLLDQAEEVRAGGVFSNPGMSLKDSAVVSCCPVS